ncbi:MAG TPA: glutathione S-transferase N-terminal domain-containing protein [Kofleriaceae bacterium]|nr:glutathione S-transferase N-terminal domain-containing protein [Microvirga sp.]HLL25207.1 glutathione S-transferase N-terminal domain-containing protein [Kofleriaceae bacterium]
MTAFADLTAYLFATPNSHRVSILLEELGLAYRVVPVNIRKREQFAPDILALNPGGRVPIVTWTEGGERRVLFESIAILQTFAEMAGSLLPRVGAARAETLAWTMIAATNLGPMTGQAHHWHDLAAEPNPTAATHARAMVARVYRVLDGRLGVTPYITGDYSIADIAAFPFVARAAWARLDLAGYPNLARWHDDISARPAVRRGVAVPDGLSLDDTPFTPSEAP